MAAVAQQVVMSVAAPAGLNVRGLQTEFQGLRMATPLRKVKSQALVAVTKPAPSLGARCDYIGSTTNLVFVASVSAFLFAGRFGLAPSANRTATAGSKLVDRPSALQTGDPAGFTATDTLAFGALGHIAAAGIVLALKYFQ
eukprot:TRINITY_DN4587_c0_g1_i1.p1 TRINITY_DN4587_c0_g1~~TRINITY_DN4587_c0_g1_i1.p1  ORF type:complete len:141 (+),score=31.71 TRINITY_DN4587_c0_g1_i1:151-573(+)